MFTHFSQQAHHTFIYSDHAVLVMNQDIIKQIVCWSGRSVTLVGYIVILGMIAGGLGLLGLALGLALFSYEGIAVVMVMSGTLFCGLGALALLRQLRTQRRELKQRLAAMSGEELAI